MAVKKTAGATKKEPTPAAILKKVATVSDTNKLLTKEIKAMSKIFSENQKVLVSMKTMIDALISATSQMQKQSKQINILEEDTQRLLVGLDQLRGHDRIVTEINQQTAKLHERLSRLENDARAGSGEEMVRQVSDSAEAIKNNSQMIIKMAQRIDEVRDQLRDVSSKAQGVAAIDAEINELKEAIQAGQREAPALREELGRIAGRIDSVNFGPDIQSMQKKIDEISAGGQKIDSLAGAIDGLKSGLEEVSGKAQELAGAQSRLGQLESQISALVERSEGSASEFHKKIDEISAGGQKIDSLAGAIDGLKSGLEEVSGKAQELAGAQSRLGQLESQISSLSEMAERSEESASEFHKKTDRLIQELHDIKGTVGRSSEGSSKEMMALLRLSEYQSSMRMAADSKYGDAGDLEKMASQTAQIVNLFDRLSIELQQEMPVPQEVRLWAVAKIFDCADRWEVRFPDVLAILSKSLGRQMLKESIRLAQVRDIFGIRAVDELREKMDITS